MQITIQIINHAPPVQMVEERDSRTETAPVVSLTTEEWTRRSQMATERAA